MRGLRTCVSAFGLCFIGGVWQSPLCPSSGPSNSACTLSSSVLLLLLLPLPTRRSQKIRPCEALYVPIEVYPANRSGVDDLCMRSVDVLQRFLARKAVRRRRAVETSSVFVSISVSWAP